MSTKGGPTAIPTEARVDIQVILLSERVLASGVSESYAGLTTTQANARSASYSSSVSGTLVS